MAEIKSKIKNREAVCKLFQELYLSLIDESSSSSSQDMMESGVEWGNVRKKFGKHLSAEFKNEFGANGQKIMTLSEAEICQKFAKLSEIVKIFEKKAFDGNIGEFSPWLKKFKRNVTKDLEIPGKSWLFFSKAFRIF